MKKIEIPIQGECSVVDCNKRSRYVFVIPGGDTYETCEEHKYVEIWEEKDDRSEN